MNQFELVSEFLPTGDQPEAISQLVTGLRRGDEKQTLLGVTGSGKTFTVANVISQVQKPTLVIAHNKTLAAQLASEFREFFPHNAVHYFVSYYDFYQPEAYMPVTDTYIEKDAQINEEIDRLRHATTQSLLTRSDVIIVASVSCIYGLGSPEEYRSMHLILAEGQSMDRRALLEHLIAIHYVRTTADLTPGTFRAVGNAVEIMPVQEKTVFRVSLNGNRITQIVHIDPITSNIIRSGGEYFLFPAKHFLTEGEKKERALMTIEQELAEHLEILQKTGKVLEYERVKRRTRYDLAMIREVGYCSGIENYSRHLSGKRPGEAPDTLLSYFPRKADGSPDFLTVIDESHVTISQIGGMYAGDRSRKTTLVEHGFRLPSAMDNRPLKSEEFWQTVGQTLFISATPGSYEREHSSQIVEQVIRPTGLVDPMVEVRPVTPTDINVGQVQDFITEAVAEIEKGGRVLATTLTKQMAEDLSVYLKERSIKAEYLHSDVQTMDRIQILTSLRKGEFDCLVGVNLLREGLDLPEVTLIGILDADKEGFLRSETALIQTIGRAARNVNGRVLAYADTITRSLGAAIDETNRRRDIQIAYNVKHGITPQSISKRINDIIDHLATDRDKAVASEISADILAYGGNLEKLIAHKKVQMEESAEALDFETAALLRDEIIILERQFAMGAKVVPKRAKKPILSAPKAGAKKVRADLTKERKEERVNKKKK